MTSGQKFSISLLISSILFGAFCVLTFSARFNFFETKFYAPSVRIPLEEKIETISKEEKLYNQLLIQKFSNFANSGECSSLTKNFPAKEESKDFSVLLSHFLSSTPDLKGIRVIDTNGKKIFFSTFESDIKQKVISSSTSTQKINYEDYSQLVKEKGEIDFENLAVSNEKKYAFYADVENQQKIYSIPFLGKNNDEELTQNAVMIFYYKSDDFLKFLCSKNILSLEECQSVEFCKLNENFYGYIFNFPENNFAFNSLQLNKLTDSILESVQKSIPKENNIFESSVKVFSNYKVVDKISNDEQKITQNGGELNSTQNLLILTKVNKSEQNENVFLSFIYDEEIFKVSVAVKILLLALFFITVFLVIFLIFNLSRDDMIVIQDKIKKFQRAFINHSLNEEENSVLKSEILSRKDEIFTELKHSLGRRGKKHSEEVDLLLEKSWREILEVVVGEKQKTVVDTAELKKILEEILKTKNIQPTAKEELEEVEEELEEVEEIPEVEEELEEVEGIPEAEEELEEVEEIPEAEEGLEEFEEIPEAEEELEEVEEIPEVEEGLEEVEEIPEVEEELEEVEEIPEVEEELEDVEEIPEVEEELEEIEEIPEAEEELEEVEEIPEAEEGLEEVEEIPEVEEELEEVEEIPEVEEELEEVEEIPEVEEEFEDVEEIPEAEEKNSLNDEKVLESEEKKSDKSNEWDFNEQTKDFEEKIPESGTLKTLSFDLSDEDFSEEKLEFSSPSSIQNQKETLESFDDFEVVNMNFSVLDSIVNSDEQNEENDFYEIEDYLRGENDSLIQNEEKEDEELEELEEIEPFENLQKGKTTFMFTNFAANNNNISDLECENSSAIVQNADGTFHIEGKPLLKDVKIDLNFKKLVDSVLK